MRAISSLVQINEGTTKNRIPNNLCRDIILSTSQRMIISADSIVIQLFTYGVEKLNKNRHFNNDFAFLDNHHWTTHCQTPTCTAEVTTYGLHCNTGVKD